MKRNFGLDIIRAFSIWLVLLQHGGIFLSNLKLGGIGVEIFFVLSGFLIGQILLRDIMRDDSFRGLKVFWIRRWFRIIPVYYLMLLINFLFFNQTVGANILYYFLFLQNNFYGIDFYKVTWSLVIEEWFYLFSPVFLLLAYYFVKKDKIKWLAMIFLFLIAENLFRLGYVLYTNVAYDGVNGNFPFRLDSLFVGMTFAYIKTFFSKQYSYLSKPWFFFFAATLLISYLLVFDNIAPQKNELLWPRTIGFFLFSLLIAMVVPFIEKMETVSQNTIVQKFFYHFINQTSLLTYSIYLIHSLIFHYFFDETKDTGYTWLFGFSFAVITTYVCAFFIYNYFEKPVMNLREKFR